MPSLYGYSGNANVAVGNTIGLYQQNAGVTQVLTTAQTLLSLLSNAGTVGFSLTSANTQVQASVDPSGVSSGTYGSSTLIPIVTVGSDGRVTQVSTVTISTQTGTYSNANVASYLLGTITVGNLITTAGVYWANGQPYSSGGTIYGNANVAAYLPTYAGTLNNSSTIIGINANLAAFETYANITYNTVANAGVLQNQINTTNANLASFETYANATFSTGNYGNSNVAAYLPTYAGTLNNSSTIVGINANLASFETYANITYNTVANAGVLQNQINTTNANLASFETYANATFSTGNYGNSNVAAYLPTYAGTLNNSSTIIGINANVTAANTAIANLQSNIGSFYTYANTTYSTQANAASQENEISSLRSNITAANTAIANLQSNIGSFYTYANVTYNTVANAGVLQNQINTTNANIGSFYTYANATYSTQANAANQESEISNLRSNITAANTAIAATNANIGSFYTYANVTYSTIANAGVLQNQINTTNANLASFETYANATFSTGGGSSYGNTNVAAYLTTATISTTGNITAANLITGGNVIGNYILGNGSKLTNLPVQAGTYTNSNVTNLLSGGTYSGDINALTGVVTAAAINSTGAITASSYVQAAQGVYSIGTFSGTYSDGIVVDYVTGNGRISVGTADNVTFYTGGVGATPTLQIAANGAAVAGNLITTNGVYWSNGAPYSTGGGGSSYGNANVADYLTTATISTTGNITAANLITNGNLITTNGVFWANGTAYSSGGGGSYGNTNVSQYLPHALGYTDGWQMPIGGNTARPSFAGNGMIRFNNDTLNPEWFSGTNSTWYNFSQYYTPGPSSYNADYLVVAGGGGGGNRLAGGGGAGGYIYATGVTLANGTVYTVVVGAGGAAGTSEGASGSNGQNSTLSGTGLSTPPTAIGGGGGGSQTAPTYNPPGNGGSGGGGADGESGSTVPGSGTTGQGYAGGYGHSGNPYGGGAGGGASAVGADCPTNLTVTGAAGGGGVAVSITGSSVYYAGGGGNGYYVNIGGTLFANGGLGGTGGGGNGGGTVPGGQAGSNGTVNTGGGGGGGGFDSTGGVGSNGGIGGSGVVIISVPTSDYSGTTTGSPTITTSGSNTIITFTASGSYTA